MFRDSSVAITVADLGPYEYCAVPIPWRVLLGALAKAVQDCPPSALEHRAQIACQTYGAGTNRGKWGPGNGTRGSAAALQNATI